jgi:hypothetical protein
MQRRIRHIGSGLVAALAVAVIGCVAASAAGAADTTPTTRHRALPAGTNPSESAKMICAQEAVTDVAQGLGVNTTGVTTPTWVNHVYSCQYQYSNGVISLAVKELLNKKQTTRYFNSLAKTLGRAHERISLGQGAFITKNGSVVVRKDYKVLEVDISKLPAQFGTPPQKPTDVALGVAATIMGCWTGA